MYFVALTLLVWAAGRSSGL